MKSAEILQGKAGRALPAAGRKTLGANPKHPPSPRDRGFLRLAHQHILGKISSGELAAGAALSELALAAQLGLSRTPVREAIGQLVAEGILQKTSRGAVVIEPTKQDIVEVYELREALETYAVTMLAGHGVVPRDMEAMEKTMDEILAIRALLEKSGKSTLEGDLLQRFVGSDIRFHMHLLEAAGEQLSGCHGQ